MDTLLIKSLLLLLLLLLLLYRDIVIKGNLTLLFFTRE